MTRTVNTCLAALAVLVLWRMEETAEACSCSPPHPQTAYCSSDVVIRAKVIEKEQIQVNHSALPFSIPQTKYKIKQLKSFKGGSGEVDAVYTAPFDGLCGATLVMDTEYLLTGRLDGEGKMHITLCDFHTPWDKVTLHQRLGLTLRYGQGCDCEITMCHSVPCSVHGPHECLWVDSIMDQETYGWQAKHYFCIKDGDTCLWYKGPRASKSK